MTKTQAQALELELLQDRVSSVTEPCQGQFGSGKCGTCTMCHYAWTPEQLKEAAYQNCPYLAGDHTHACIDCAVHDCAYIAIRNLAEQQKGDK